MSPGDEGALLFVVAIDGTESGEKALAEAVRQGAQLGAEIALVMVVVPASMALRGPRRQNMDELRAELEIAAADTVHAAAVRAQQAGLKASTRVLTAENREDIGPAIAGYAANHGASIIFVGSHDRSLTARDHLGSVAEGLQAVATCPVSVVR